MAQSITITMSNADAANVAKAYGVTTTAEFKAVLVKEIKAKTKEYLDREQFKAITPSAEPDVT